MEETKQDQAALADAMDLAFEDARDTTPLEAAMLSMKRLAWHKKVLAKHEALAARREHEIKDKIGWHETNLKNLSQILAKEYGKDQTDLGDGAWIKVTTKRGTFEITDEMAVKKFAHEMVDQGVGGIVKATTTVKIDKKALRDSLREDEDGNLVDPRTGEICEFAKVVSKGEKGLKYETGDL